MTEIFDAVQGIVHEKGISSELVRQVIEECLKAAYKKHFGTDENAVVEFDDQTGQINVYARREVVDDDDLYDPVGEIELSEARKIQPNARKGEFILVKVDTSEFDRMDVYSARQKARQYLRDILKDTLYSEFKDKVNKIIIGYYRREQNGTIYVDLGKAEGILPKRNQSPKEVYRVGDRIKSLVQEVRKTPKSLEIILTRRDPEFVKKLFELEVPEIADGTVIIHKIVREAGYRTKIAVRSTKEDVDPVGACVGLKGARIQNIMKELEGERIDILRYDPDPQVYIANALLPAKVKQVIILDSLKRSAVAIVEESELSLAIGKMGTNVKLANRLVDWNIDVRTEQQLAEIDFRQEYRSAMEDLFQTQETEEDVEIVTTIRQLEGVPQRVADILEQNGYVYISQIENVGRQSLEKISGLTPADLDALFRILSQYHEVEEEEEEYELFCPQCNYPIDLSMTHCPNCGVQLSFEFEDEEGEEEE